MLRVLQRKKTGCVLSFGNVASGFLPPHRGASTLRCCVHECLRRTANSLAAQQSTPRAAAKLILSFTSFRTPLLNHIAAANPAHPAQLPARRLLSWLTYMSYEKQ